jgi:hypothetical protein
MGADDDLEHEFPCWHWWRGVGDTGFYVRRERSSPPIVLRAESLDDLKSKVREHIAARERGS